MKFTLSWLKEHLETQASLADISARLTAIGLEVEGVEDKSITLKGFVVGHVLSAEKHPDADKLRCLIVDTGKEQLKVVCGAPNARAGMKGVFAPAGSFIPGSNITLKKTMIRGQESNGMMCSARELLLGDDHAGIIDLPDSLPTGSSASSALGIDDPVIEINLTPNRGDCAGVYGIARDLAATGIGTLKPPKIVPVTGAFKNPVTVTLKDAGCTLFLGRYIRGCKVSVSPDWLQKRLKSVGASPISAPVDITNYMTLAFSRPLHVFDAKKLKGNLHVRSAHGGETLVALNDKTYALDDGTIAVCDDSGVLGLGGIIGGVTSSVTAETTDLYIECALFDAAAIARTGQKLQIDSDARYRFERGVDPAFAAAGMEMATRLILDLCGGEASDVFIAGSAASAPRVIAYNPQRLKTLGGRDLTEERQKEILTALGFVIAPDWRVTTPTWRHDVTGVADLVEEILRIDGYDNIPPVAVVRSPGSIPPPLAPIQMRARRARAALTRRGMLETVTWSFMDSDLADSFGAHRGQNKASLTLLNPISADLSVMRPSILPNLIQAAGRNADRGFADVALFEIGNVYASTKAEGQVPTATGARSGAAVTRHWSSPVRAVDALDAKADALSVLESCGVNVNSLQVTRDAPDWYHPGRSGVFRLGSTVLACFGEIHPSVLAVMKRDEAVCGFEVFLPYLPAAKKKGTRKDMLRLSPLQPLMRDFAFIVDAAAEAESIRRAALAVDKVLVTGAEIFDVYAGKGVEAGKKSIGLTVTIQPVEKTLTDEDISALCARIVAAVEKETGGTLRA